MSTDYYVMINKTAGVLSLCSELTFVYIGGVEISQKQILPVD
jgi:hypothetical protein